MTDARPGLAARGLTVRYGGLCAVNDVSFAAPVGRVTGLVGPNGAGKTTTFAACTGLVRPTTGTVALFEQDVTALSAQARAQRGLGRTFQRMELFESLSVRANVSLGLEGRLAGSRPWRHLRAPSSEVERIAAATEDAIERCGLGDLAELDAGELSTGQGRLVELARVIAGGFPLLLLDEPSSGLDKVETRAFGAIVRELVDDAGRGILLVEHDMALVAEVCDYVYVLDFGELIFEGTPAEMLESADVQAAYLGSALEAST